MILAWENQSGIRPQDTTHVNAHLRANVSMKVDVEGHAVLPLVLTVGDRSYPTCTNEPSVLEQLPGFDEINFDNAQDRMMFVTEAAFDITGNIQTRTIGRVTYITSLNPG